MTRLNLLRYPEARKILLSPDQSSHIGLIALDRFKWARQRHTADALVETNTAIRWRRSSCLGRDGIKPTQPTKPRKITIGGAHKPVFHSQHSKLSVWYKIAMYAGQREKLT